VDSLWVRKHGATKEDYLELCQEIENEIGMPISFEGIYRWVAFLPSRMHEDVPVLNRYFGVFEDGTVKVRGIEMRRRDTIKLVSDCQNEILSLLSSGTTVDEVKQLLPQVVEIVRRYVDFINSGKIPFSDLTIVNGLSKNFNEYGSNQVHVGAIKQLAEEGLELMAGQSVSYVVTNYRSKIPEERARPVELLDDSVTYDKTRYTEILMRGIGTLLEPFGISGERLDHLVRSVGEAKQESVFAAEG
jgi:DNA polymerase-2